MNGPCVQCGASLDTRWLFCPQCGTTSTQRAPTHPEPEPAPARGGYSGLLYGILVAPMLIIVGTLLCLTGLGAVLGVPMIVAAALAPLAGPLLGMGARRARCPWCGMKVATSADGKQHECPSCSHSFAVRGHEGVKAS